MKVSKIYQNVANAELLYRKRNACPLFGLDDLNLAIAKCGEIEYDMSHAFPYNYRDEPRSDLRSSEEYEVALGKSSREFVEVMKKYPGKLFIAGGSLAGFLTGQQDGVRGDIDVFIVEESAEAAERLLTAIISELPIRKQESTAQVTTCFLEPSPGDYFGLEVQFIRRVYPSPDVILMKFDLWACQYLWSPSTGIRMTLMGLAALVMKAFPEDCSVHSVSINHRRYKYCNEKYFRVLFPGVPKGCNVRTIGPESARIVNLTALRNIVQENDGLYPPEPEDSNDEEGPNPWLAELGIREDGEPIVNERGSSSEEEVDRNQDVDITEILKDLVDVPQPAEQSYAKFNINWAGYSSDYSSSGQDYMNPWHLAKGNHHNILIKFNSYSQFCGLLEDQLVDEVFFGWKNPFEFRRDIKPTSIKKLFRDPEEYKKWATYYYVENNLQAAKDLWESIMRREVQPLLKLFGPGTSPVDLWKTRDPGSQQFGQVNPTPIHPREFYGPIYKPTYVGIQDEIYYLLQVCFSQYQVPRDVRRLLFIYVLKAQERDAIRLLLR